MNQLHRITQKDLYVGQYREKKWSYSCYGIREEPRLTISRFQSGLNFDIRYKVELLPYNDLNDLIQLCIRVEDQLNRKNSFRKSFPYSSHSNRDF